MWVSTWEGVQPSSVNRFAIASVRSSCFRLEYMTSLSGTLRCFSSIFYIREGYRHGYKSLVLPSKYNQNLTLRPSSSRPSFNLGLVSVDGFFDGGLGVTTWSWMKPYRYRVRVRDKGFFISDDCLGVFIEIATCIDFISVSKRYQDHRKVDR